MFTLIGGIVSKLDTFGHSVSYINREVHRQQEGVLLVTFGHPVSYVHGLLYRFIVLQTCEDVRSTMPGDERGSEWVRD